MSVTRGRRFVTCLLLLAFFAGCSSGHGAGNRLPYPKLTPVAADPKFADAVTAARAHGLRVWLESDLVKQWKAGRVSFNHAVAQIASLAARPGVVGVKIADELGDRDGLQGRNLMHFLRDSRAALRVNAPGKLILIDIIGYELSCAPGISSVASPAAACDAHERKAHPGVTLQTLQSIVDSGYVDVIDLSTNMAEPAVYQSWGISRADAQRAAFAEVRQRGWGSKVRIQTRKALAFPTDQIPDARTADALVPDFVDVPLSAGAAAVDIWTFSQVYDGRLVHLTNPGLTTNALWQALCARHRAGDVLFTHYSPTFPFGSSVDDDMAAIAEAFTDVFVAAGTG